jgi:hypothetical protein
VGFVRQKINNAARYFDDKPLWISCLLIFVVCAGIRAALIIVTRQYENFEYPEPIKIAHSIAKTGVFGNPFRVPTGPTAHTPPFVPFLLSFVYRFFSPGEHTELVQEFLSTAVCSLQYALLPVAAVVFGWRARVGIFAGLFGALIPFRFWLETKGTFEQVYAALALLLVTMMTAKAWRSGRLGLGSAVLQGAAWALVFHISASFLPICVTMLAVYAVVLWPERIGAYVRFLAAMGVTILILLVPWTLRNYKQFGKVFFMRDNLGLELDVSNSDDASPLFDLNIQAPSYRHPHGSRAEAEKVLEMGEIAYNQERMQEAKAWIKTHPGRFLQLTLERVFYFWFPPMQRMWQTATYVLITVLGFAGVWAALRRKQMAVWLILSIWLTFPLIYYVIESYARYRYPMDWTFLLMGSYGLVVWLMDETPVNQEQWLASRAS